MSIPNNMPEEIQNISSSLFELVKETVSAYDKPSVVRDIFDRIIFRETNYDLECADKIDPKLRNKLIAMRAKYLEIRRYIMFKNHFVELLRIYDEKQELYKEPKSVVQSPAAAAHLPGNTLFKKRPFGETIQSETKIPDCKQDLARDEKLARQVRVQEKTSKVVSELAPLVVTAERLDDTVAPSLKQTRTGERSGIEATEDEEFQLAIQLSLETTINFAQTPSALGVVTDQKCVLPSAIDDDSAIALKMQEDLNKEELDKSMTKSSSVNPFYTPAAASQPIKKVDEDEILVLEEKPFSHEMDDYELALSLQNEDYAFPEDSSELGIDLSLETPFMNAPARQKLEKKQAKELGRNFMMDHLAMLDIPAITVKNHDIPAKLKRTTAGSLDKLDSSEEVLLIPGVGSVVRTPTGRLVDRNAASNQKLHAGDWAQLEAGVTGVRFECSTGNKITTDADCEIEISDIKNGQITIVQSKVTIHNATNCMITILGNSQVTIIGDSTNNAIKVDRNYKLNISPELAKRNIFI